MNKNTIHLISGIVCSLAGVLFLNAGNEFFFIPLGFACIGLGVMNFFQVSVPRKSKTPRGNRAAEIINYSRKITHYLLVGFFSCLASLPFFALGKSWMLAGILFILIGIFYFGCAYVASESKKCLTIFDQPPL